LQDASVTALTLVPERTLPRRTSPRFVPGSTNLLDIGEHDGTRLLDVRTGDVIRELPEIYGSYPRFSADGSLLAIFHFADCSFYACKTNDLQIWDARSWTLVRTFSQKDWRFNAAVISPDNKRVVTTSGEHSSRVWSIESGQMLFSLVGHSAIVFGTAWSDDGTKIATASRDKSVRVWDAASGRAIATLGPISDYSPAEVRFDAAGRQLTACAQGHIQTWDLETRGSISDIVIENQYCGSLLRVGSRGKALVRFNQLYWIDVSSDGARMVGARQGDPPKVWRIEKTD
jgi:WD40 repeat protein